MAASIRSSIVTNGTTASATPVVNLPATVSAGDTLFVVFRVAVAGAIGWPGGAGVWNELFDASDDASDDQMAAAWKKADGTEGGTTITLSCTSGKFAACAWAVQDAVDPTVQPPELSTVATGTSAAEPDATTVTPTGGSKDYLWLTFFGMEGEQTGITAYPTNYTAGQLFAESGSAGLVTTNVRVAGAARSSVAASEDAGVWDVTGTLDDWSAYTAAFHPATVARAPAVGTLSLAGTAAVLALTMGLSSGALAFTGPAPTLIVDAGTTIQVPAGSLTFTGNPFPTVSYTAFEPAPLVFTGYAPTVIAGAPGTSIPIDAGALALSGQGVSLAFGTDIDVGSLTLTGTTPGVSTGVAASPDAGALSFTGEGLSLAFGTDISAGVLSLTGQSLTLTTGGSNTDLPIDAGTLTLTGQAPTLGLALDIGAGTLTFTGTTPTLVGDGAIAIAQGTLTLSGQAPTLAFTIPIDAGALAFTGQAFALPFEIAISTGSLTLSGTTPTVVGAGGVSPDTGVLTLTGYAPAVVLTTVYAPGAGSLSFTGLTPAVVIGQPITIGAGALVLTGSAPTLGIAEPLSIGVGTLTFVGTVPTLGFDYVITSGTGVLTFTGYAPTVVDTGAPLPPNVTRASGVLVSSASLARNARVRPASSAIGVLVS